MKIQRLKQNSPQWHEARAKEGLCLASQAGAVMNVGKFKPRNQDELLQLKRGELKIVFNKAMAHGNQYEAKARAWVEENTRQILEPVSLCREIDGLNFWASLDGATMDLDYSVEIKCPLKGDQSELWKYTDQHLKPPPHYYWQMVHQWMTSGAEENYFVVYDAAKGSALSIAMRFTEEDARQLHEGWKTFWARYYSAEPLASKYIERASPEWCEAARDWRASKALLDSALAAEKKSRERLIALAGENSAQGEGVKLKRYYTKGAIDYSQVPEIAGIDLEQYRKEGNYRWRIDADSEVLT